MKRTTVISLCILLCVCIVGCTADTNSPITSLSSEFSSNPAIETSSTCETTRENESTLSPDTNNTAKPNNSDTNSETSDIGTENNSKPETSNVSTEPNKPEYTKKPELATITENNNKPETSKPQETKPTIETAKPTDKPKPTEPEKTTKPTEPEPQEDPYLYPFNIEQIRKNCINQGKGYGLILDENLTPDNASWAGAETATFDTDGQFLKRLLYEMVEYYSPEYRRDMGLQELNITAFNIYCEPLDNNTYRIYFLFIL